MTSCLLVITWLATNPFTPSQLFKIISKPRSVIIIIFELIIFLQLFSIIDITINDIPFRNQLITVGIVINISGTFLAIWARLVMQNNWGPPAQHDISKQSKLVTARPFSISRNPIYLGLFLTLVGIELSLLSFLIFLAIPLIFLMQKAIFAEEKLLEKYFGKKYLEYKRRVPRFFPKTI